MVETLNPNLKPSIEPKVLPLHNGDRLTREEFHRRYAAMGNGVRAELIEGVVYVEERDMPSPVSIDKHSQPHFDLSGWLFTYCRLTQGLVRGIDGTIFADRRNEPQPDVLLGIPAVAGGQTRTVSRGEKQYVLDAPELVGEVSASTASIDLGDKHEAYQRNGVQEYVVVLTEEDPPEVRWFSMIDGKFERVLPEAGIIRSRVFPGLWLNVAALLAGDLAGLAATVEAGCETADHATFVDKLRLRS